MFRSTLAISTHRRKRGLSLLVYDGECHLLFRSSNISCGWKIVAIAMSTNRLRCPFFVCACLFVLHKGTGSSILYCNSYRKKNVDLAAAPWQCDGSSNRRHFHQTSRYSVDSWWRDEFNVARRFDKGDESMEKNPMVKSNL
jgi:hypothetical protein